LVQLHFGTAGQLILLRTTRNPFSRYSFLAANSCQCNKNSHLWEIGGYFASCFGASVRQWHRRSSDSADSIDLVWRHLTCSSGKFLHRCQYCYRAVFCQKYTISSRTVTC